MKNLQPPEETTSDKLYNLLKGTIGIIPYAGNIVSEAFGIIVTSPIANRRQKWAELPLGCSSRSSAPAKAA